MSVSGSRVLEKLQDAEMVLVGIGEDMQYDWSALTRDERFCEIENEIGGDKGRIWVIPFLQRMILQQKRDDQWRQAYKDLGKMLAGRNYYIVSLCIDDYLYGAGLDEKRIVTPCGGFRKMQCDNNCSHMLSDIPQETYEAVLRYYGKEISVGDLKEPVCPVCGAKLRFNQLGVTRYAEEGYLPQWADYMKWLQGTVNRKICVLELGVGMDYPTVIRFPFEKIVTYNRKAFLFRVHPSLFQIGEEIGDRGMSIKENPVSFIKAICEKM